MTETAGLITAGRAAEYAHILADLHEQRAAIAGLCAAVARIEQTVGELAPAARRAAAMLDTPVTAYLAARRESANGERLASTPGPRPRRGMRPGRARGKAT
jgi:hypothetical protein